MEEDVATPVSEQVYERPGDFSFGGSYEVLDAGDGITHVKPEAELSDGRQDYDIVDQNGNRLFWFFVEEVIPKTIVRGPTSLQIHERNFNEYIFSMLKGYTYCEKPARRITKKYRFDSKEIDDALRVGACCMDLHIEIDGAEQERLERGIEVQVVKDLNGNELVRFVGNPAPYKHETK